MGATDEGVLRNMACCGEYLPVAPNDSSDLPGGVCVALLVGTAGSANLIDMTGSTRTAVPLQAGYNPIRAKRVMTGGTASNIWALYYIDG